MNIDNDNKRCLIVVSILIIIIMSSVSLSVQYLSIKFVIVLAFSVN